MIYFSITSSFTSLFFFLGSFFLVLLVGVASLFLEDVEGVANAGFLEDDESESDSESVILTWKYT